MAMVVGWVARIAGRRPESGVQGVIPDCAPRAPLHPGYAGCQSKLGKDTLPKATTIHPTATFRESTACRANSTALFSNCLNNPL